ncbi:hypothetical protein NDU88_007037 [Pleurodeles waltl]|uniref:Uncharacterized protein n=1 Tax=Pleurodeles waltl TaxID=8319 RepID=A0AAV7SRD7_PLEWA|nr:hypothetical protein NDU88_007037 [Pleurodeles waltl]
MDFDCFLCPRVAGSLVGARTSPSLHCSSFGCSMLFLPGYGFPSGMPLFGFGIGGGGLLLYPLQPLSMRPLQPLSGGHVSLFFEVSVKPRLAGLPLRFAGKRPLCPRGDVGRVGFQEALYARSLRPVFACENDGSRAPPLSASPQPRHLRGASLSAASAESRGAVEPLPSGAAGGAWRNALRSLAGALCPAEKGPGEILDEPRHSPRKPLMCPRKRLIRVGIFRGVRRCIRSLRRSS